MWCYIKQSKKPREVIHKQIDKAMVTTLLEITNSVFLLTLNGTGKLTRPVLNLNKRLVVNPKNIIKIIFALF